MWKAKITITTRRTRSIHLIRVKATIRYICFLNMRSSRSLWLTGSATALMRLFIGHIQRNSCNFNEIDLIRYLGENHSFKTTHGHMEILEFRSSWILSLTVEITVSFRAWPSCLWSMASGFKSECRVLSQEWCVVGSDLTCDFQLTYTINILLITICPLDS